ncbi:MAG: Calcineurin-like phosphoesterase [candidate division TA06 bacterium ADurb.Bin417]|uniref:Calcineurin-like phosphoesterase n=1 Tax=candidate division TA06 bacterium ADurb.Bin417 TaxID=1852828 RepID=A0A1V5MHL2_UNCT6|nr:MAG: Calcineurin-like phosphoesterase [candidate division TA06 bacterium ADurb.Bin417]
MKMRKAWGRGCLVIGAAILAIAAAGSASAGPEAGPVLFRFAQISDPHISAANSAYQQKFSAAVETANRLKPDFVLITGDLAVPADAEENWKKYAELRGGLAAPVYEVPGNNDMQKDASFGHYEKYARPAASYAFEHKGFRFVCLNDIFYSEGEKAASHRGRITDFAWLEKEFETGRTGKGIILVAHIPASDTLGGGNTVNEHGGATGRYQLYPLLEKYRVAAFIAGHVHRFGGEAAFYTLHVTAPATSFGDIGLLLYEVRADSLTVNRLNLGRDDPVETVSTRFGRLAEPFRTAPVEAGAQILARGDFKVRVARKGGSPTFYWKDWNLGQLVTYQVEANEDAAIGVEANRLVVTPVSRAADARAEISLLENGFQVRYTLKDLKGTGRGYFAFIPPWYNVRYGSGRLHRRGDGQWQTIEPSRYGPNNFGGYDIFEFKTGWGYRYTLDFSNSTGEKAAGIHNWRYQENQGFLNGYHNLWPWTWEEGGRVTLDLKLTVTPEPAPEPSKP